MGSDLLAKMSENRPVGFNSRSRMGSDLIQLLDLKGLPRFNSRSRMGSDAASRQNQYQLYMFQFTLPHGERRLPPWPIWPPLCFNSRSRMGSDLQGLASARFMDVSIHAPAWGATGHCDSRAYFGACFNSRSRMGSDAASRQNRYQFYMFQFTLPHGERHNTPHSPFTGLFVSIHAPAWGATSGCQCSH